MFTLDQIKAAHSKVKSGADFPKYVQDLIGLGVEAYSTYVIDGHAEYFGKNGYQIKSDAKYAGLNIAEKSDSQMFINRLKFHQQGQSDYMTFCNDSASNGVEKWIVDTQKMSCTYYDKLGNKMLEEKIPTV
jgi:uncharacterized protein YbcV (DUF1398 family)